MTDIPPPPMPPQPPMPGQPQYGMGPSDSKNSLGTWALVLGILSIVCCGLLAGIPAIILGNKSKEAAAQGLATNGNLGQVGFVLGIIGSVLSVVAGIFWGILAATGNSTY